MLPTSVKQRAGLKPHAGAVLALAFLASMAQGAYAQRGAGPFARMGGSWSGHGIITTSNGTRERIRCVATYTVGEAGHSLVQNLRCASDSYKFYVTSDVHDDGGRVSGTWAETTRGASGAVTGRVNDSEILATVSGAGFTAGLALVTRGGSQTVRIRPAGGTDVVDVSVNLRRG